MNRVSIIAAMHGDEVYGIELYEAFIATYPHLQDNVQLVIGNERAYQDKVRFIDSDMNRHYANDTADHEYSEMQRVEQLLNSFKSDYVIDIHTTRRNSGVFYITDTLNTRRERICAMLDIDVCIMKGEVIKTSFIGNYKNSVSLEYSLKSISEDSTYKFIEALKKLVANEPYKLDTSRLYEVKRLIAPDEWRSYVGLRNYDEMQEGIALMVPADVSEMDAEYYGFWCARLN